jgi:putative membrane protein
MTSRTLALLAAATLGISGLASAQMAPQDQGTAKPPDQAMPTGAGQSDANRTGTDAAQRDNTATPTDQKISDRDFVRRAASSGSYEVAASNWVQDKAKDPQIKQLARTMESDHKQTNNELKDIAKQSNIDVPAGPQGADQQMLSQLKQANDQQVDQQYLQQMIQAHQQGVALFRQAQDQCQDPKLKSFAQKTLPKLEEHLQHLQQMSTSAQPAGAAMPGSSDQQQPGKSNPNQPTPMPPRSGY